MYPLWGRCSSSRLTGKRGAKQRDSEVRRFTRCQAIERTSEPCRPLPPQVHNIIAFTTINMPPRLQLLRRAAVTIPSQQSYQPLAPFLYPFLSQQRSASILSSLSDTKGAYNKRIRRGRGPASGKGKTSGRGHKGQKQHGKVPVGFNGGQTPDWVVAGPRGFDNQ